ncbi:MAG TPA: TonB-dependent siderophore receptor [Methylocella sp.]|nr:TonB-dependent siderophore receptor [Methylocella sp.]
MGSALAAIALSAFAMEAPSSTAQASIPPQEISDAVKAYAIPPGSMAAALTAFADMSGLHLLYDADVTLGLKTRGLSGRYSPQQGIEQLLSGTGLTYRFVRKGSAVSIILAQNDTSTRSDAGAIELPTVDVTATQGAAGGGGPGGTGCGPYGGAPCSGFGGAGLAQDPFNPSYVLPTASTGTKTDTPVMDTPLNVQSVSQQVLQDQQAITLEQVLQNVSGIAVAPGSGIGTATVANGIFLRGFQADTYYHDGFRWDTTALGGTFDLVGSQQLANIASVEVLKGPGAVLYGLVEPGGIINLVTKEPLDAPYFAVQQQIGSLALYRTTVDATGPVTDDKSVLYRMNMSYENNGAPYDSLIDFTNVQNIFLAPVIKWNIDGATWVKLEAEYNYNRSSFYNPLDPVFNGVFVPIPRSTNYGESSPFLQTDLFSALTWSHNFNSDWSIKQQIAYFLVDTQGTDIALPINIVSGVSPLTQVQGYNSEPLGRQAVYSTNVDITGHFNTLGAQHTLLLGGDIYKTTGVTNFLFSETDTSINLFGFNPIHPASWFPFCNPCADEVSAYTQETAGLYLQDQIKLPYNFYVLAGARYQYIQQTAANGSNQFEVTPLGNPLVGEAVTPRFGLLWRPQEWVSFYGNYTEGFGPNTGAFIYPNELAPPTSADSAEAGVKLEFFNGKLRATADYFDLTKTNVPVTDLNAAQMCGFGGPGSCSLLVGKARSKGPELDIQGEILPGWSVIASYTNDDVRVTQGSSSTSPQTAGLAPGQRLPFVPRNAGSLWTTYEFQDETLKGLKIGAGYQYVGSRPIDAEGSAPGAFALLPSYGVVNLMAAYSFKLNGANVTAQLNINNLLDTTYYTAAYYGGPPVPYGSTAATSGLQYGVRQYGAPFAAVGSLRVQYPADATPAFSPPPPPPLVFTGWTGFYAGAQIGYAWGDNDGAVSYASPGGLFGAYPLGNDGQGVIGGAHAGYNYQTGQYVFGLEGAVDPATLTRSVLVVPTDGSTITGNIRSGIQGSIRARAGYAFDRLLLYSTGGVAFASFGSDLQLQGSDALGPFYANGSRSSSRTGWTAGAGVEYAINNNWSVEAEYRYSDFGHITDLTVPGVVGTFETGNRQLSQNQVQVGFSYNFDSSAPDSATSPVGAAPFDFSQIQISQIDPRPGPAGATPSFAAGLFPPPPLGPVDWTGIDLGFQAGYAWNNGNLNFTGVDSSTGSPVNNSFIDTHNGAIGGAHLGYNYQINQWVVGVEGSVDLTSSLSTASFPSTFGGSSLTASTASNVQGSIRARLGYAFDRALIYATGGVAFGEYPTSYQLIGNYSGNAGINGGNLFTGSNFFTNFPVGWTAGGGIEYAIDGHWSVRGEYRYTSFGTVSNSFVDGGALALASGLVGSSLNANHQLNQNQVEAGFSYKFDLLPPPAPIVAKY